MMDEGRGVRKRGLLFYICHFPFFISIKWKMQNEFFDSVSLALHPSSLAKVI